MRRRDFIGLVGGRRGPVAAGGACAKAVPPCGCVFLRRPSTRSIRATRSRVRPRASPRRGLSTGKTVKIEYLSSGASGQYDRLPAMARDLASSGASMLSSPPARRPVRAAKAAAATLPIIFTTDRRSRLQIGFVASLNRPGGNMTGVTLLSARASGPKLLELLHRRSAYGHRDWPPRQPHQSQLFRRAVRRTRGRRRGGPSAIELTAPRGGSYGE